jgi:hypothetical protein
VFSLEKKGFKLKKLTFNDGLTTDKKNLFMRGCFFSENNKSIYTIATAAKHCSYLIKWDASGQFNPKNVSKVHNNTATGMRVSTSGK